MMGNRMLGVIRDRVIRFGRKPQSVENDARLPRGQVSCKSQDNWKGSPCHWRYLTSPENHFKYWTWCMSVWMVQAEWNCCRTYFGRNQYVIKHFLFRLVVWESSGSSSGQVIGEVYFTCLLMECLSIPWGIIVKGGTRTDKYNKEFNNRDIKKKVYARFDEIYKTYCSD